MGARDLLFELLTEELPPRTLQGLSMCFANRSSAAISLNPLRVRCCSATIESTVSRKCATHSEPRTDAHTIRARRANETELARVGWIGGKYIPRQGSGKYAEDRETVADILHVCAYEPGIVG